MAGRETHLLHERILQRQMIPSVDEELILQMLRRMEILARRLFPVTPTLDAVVAGGDTSVLHLDVGWWMCELALCIRSGAFVPLELPADLQLQPTGILPVQQIVHVNHGHFSVAVVGGRRTAVEVLVRGGVVRVVRRVNCDAVGRTGIYHSCSVLFTCKNTSREMWRKKVMAVVVIQVVTQLDS